MDIRDLAKTLRVSIATVSRALNPATDHLVAEPVRRRIQAYADKAHYRPSQLGRNLARGRTQTIGMILYSVYNSLFFDHYMAQVLWGISLALAKSPHYSYKTLLLLKGRSLTEADQHVIGGSVDGILISTVCDNSIGRLQELASMVERRWRKPVVALNLDPTTKSKISTVSFSNREAGAKAAMHLLQRGHRLLGLVICDDGSPDFRERILGFKNTVNDHRYPIKPAAVAAGDSSVDGGYRATIELFKRPENSKLTAIFCICDEMALGAMRALRVLGKKCPAEIAVMGFDGLPMGEFTSPQLTSVSQPIFEIAQSGAQLLLDLIEKRVKTPIHLSVSSKLLIRESA